MNKKIDLSACVVGNGFINVYDEPCFLSEINHDNEFPYTLVYADGSKHNYRYDGFTNSAQGNLKEQFGWIEADEMIPVLENFGYDIIDLNRKYDDEIVELYVKEMYSYE